MTMNIKFSSLIVATLLLLLLSSSRDNNGGVVDAAAGFSDTVTCLADAPTICAGSTSYTTPSPASINGETTYMGGYSFTYNYMDGLENYNGTFMMDILDPNVVAQAKETSLEVRVSVDDDGNCIIDVGNEICSTCSIDCGDGDGDDNNDNESSIGISFDCTNVPNGRASTTCEYLTVEEGLFYPLMYTTATNGDASSSTTAATSTSNCGLLAADTLPQEDADCTAAMPDGISTISCWDISYDDSFSTQTERDCTCDRTNNNDPIAIWKCTSTEKAIEPNQSCPSQDQPKVSGDSCVGQLSQPNSSMTCMWSRQLELDLEVFNCECNRGAAADGSSSTTTDDGNEVWVCDGAFAPPIVVDDPTMDVDADTPQDVVTTPITTTTSTVSKEENDTAVDADVDVGVADEPTNSMGSSSAAAVNYFAAVMAVGIVVVITTTATIF